MAEEDMPTSHAKALRPYLTCATRQGSDRGRILLLKNTNLKQIAAMYSDTAISSRLEKLLRLVVERSGGRPGQLINFLPDIDYPCTDALTPQEMIEYKDYLVGKGLLEAPKWAQTMEQQNVKLTLRGWTHLDPIRGGSPEKGLCFVAMSFDRQMDDAFDNGINPAIQLDCKLRAQRLDRVHHTEKICDKVIADIRRAEIVIVDVTGARPNVYFEAGFAMALGRPVIFTCKKSESEPQFDTRQYPHIFWDAPNDLRSQLADRILAILPMDRTDSESMLLT